MSIRFIPGVWVAAALGLACHAAIGADPPSTGSTESQAALEQLNAIERSLDARDYAAASKAIDEIFGSASFRGLPPQEQYSAFVFAAYATLGREDLLTAHEYAMAATSYPMATGETWALRTALAIDVQNWGDAGEALTALANQWPAQLPQFGALTVHNLASSMRDDPQLEQPRLELIAALYNAKYTVEYGFEPAYLWQDLAAALLEKKHPELALEVLERIDDPGVLARMRIDRRFDELVKARPRAFDIGAIAKTRCKQIHKVMEQHPRDLQPAIEFMYAQYTVGAFKQNIRFADHLLKSAQAAPERPPFDADKLNWIYDIKARSLRALGRWDESLQVQKQASARLHVSQDKVSQAINLGFFFNEHGEPAKALEALEVVDWGKSLSGFGRMQLEHVRLRAYLQLGQRDEADTVMAYLRENQKEAPDTWQSALLDWGDMDGAATLFIARLRDPRDRVEALWSAQTFPPLPVMPAEKESGSRWEAMLKRKDVTAAIDEVGRREKLPIYDIN